jgi:two-component system KDP operon response regulator KdpE
MARVLVIEDNAGICMTLGALCEMWKHEVATAMSAREALALVAAFEPSIIILDLTLPSDTEGLDLVRRLRAGDSAVHIIALSAWLTPASRARARALVAGANVFMPKPPGMDELKRAVARAVTRPTAPRRHP